MCGAPPAGWIVDAQGKALRPPTAKDALGKVVELTSVSQFEARFTIVTGVATAKPGPVIAKASVLRCPMEPVSGPVFRILQSARIIVRLGAGCARDVDALRFFSGTRAVDVADSASKHGWLEQNLTGGGPSNVSPRAFIFGPSISIGNIGGTF